ncbi:Transmembrane channel-like protein 7, partial [Stegodyphus mimosarum]
MIDQDILSYAGTLFDHYIPNEILDLTLNYDRRNRTHEERHNISEYCRWRYVNDLQNTSLHTSNKFEDVLQGTGVLETTLLFLGSYPPKEVAFLGYIYSMPLAFLSVLIISFILSIIMMVQYSSHGIEETMLLKKSNYLIYSNIMFCSWDYCIEDKKSARVRHKSIANEIKNNLAEERRKLEIKEWSNAKKTRVLILRIFVNLFVLLTLLGCYYLIYEVVHYQLKELQLHRIKNIGANTLFVQYLSPLVITGLNLVVPIIFLNIVKLEMYNTQTQINMALFRIVFLRLSSVFVLVSTLHQQLTCQPRDMCNAGISAACRTPLCWETYVGQQIYKLVITDFFVYILIFICYDIPRDLIVRSCKNKVTELVGRQVFDLPNQVLSLVYSQTLCWLGIFYSPVLPAVTVIKFGILFYIKKRLVLHFSIPPPVPYKASRTNAIFMIILLLSFFAVLIIHGYSVSSIDPSPGCSPFRYEDVMINAIPDAMFSQSPKLTEFVNFIFSAFFFFPAYIFLGIAMYYYWTISVT